ncbi:MAG: hypothetical protein S4CHLAM37_16750 [Chlamydiia bacterium]|nr:hypothetical protein [Chlamydiia bacterium]
MDSYIKPLLFRGSGVKFTAIAMLSAASMFFMSFANRKQPAHIKDFAKCLNKSYELEDATVSLIMKRCSSLLDNEEADTAVKDFISNSKELLLIHAPNKVTSLSEHDALVAAPKTHELLYEDTENRILFINIDPGEEVTPHCHQYNGVMLLMNESKFLTIDDDGNTEEEYWDISSEILPGSKKLHSYKNIGHNTFFAILFELK